VELAMGERLKIRTGSFVDELLKRKYSKVLDTSLCDFISIRGVASVEEQRRNNNIICYRGFEPQVILMDHVDWLGQNDIDVLCNALKEQVIVRT
jgi:hypothetical protein